MIVKEEPKKVWVLAARAHSYFPQLNVGQFILVPEDQVQAVERRRLIVDQFFRDDPAKGCACRA